MQIDRSSQSAANQPLVQPTQSRAKGDVNHQRQAVNSQDTLQQNKVQAEDAIDYSKFTEKVIHSIEDANKKIEVYDTKLEFSIHEKTHAIMIKVVKDDEVIREFPPEKILDMVAKMMELAGLIVDEKV